MNKVTLGVVAVVCCGCVAFGLSGWLGRPRVAADADGDDSGRRSQQDRSRDKDAADVHLPPDDSGPLLDAQLPPHRQAPAVPSGHATGPRREVALPDPEQSDSSLTPNLAEPVRPQGEPPARPTRLAPLPGDDPLTWDHSEPAAPERQALRNGGRASVPALASNQALPRPALGQGSSTPKK